MDDRVIQEMEKLMELVSTSEMFCNLDREKKVQALILMAHDKLSSFSLPRDERSPIVSYFVDIFIKKHDSEKKTLGNRGKWFTCGKCSLSYPYELFGCRTCSMKFKSMTSLYRHDYEDHGVLLPNYTCKICKCPFNNPFHLDSHYFERHVCSMRHFECRFGCETLQLADEIHNHLQMHQQKIHNSSQLNSTDEFDRSRLQLQNKNVTSNISMPSTRKTSVLTPPKFKGENPNSVEDIFEDTSGEHFFKSVNKKEFSKGVLHPNHQDLSVEESVRKRSRLYAGIDFIDDSSDERYLYGEFGSREDFMPSKSIDSRNKCMSSGTKVSPIENKEFIDSQKSIHKGKDFNKLMTVKSADSISHSYSNDDDDEDDDDDDDDDNAKNKAHVARRGLGQVLCLLKSDKPAISKIQDAKVTSNSQESREAVNRRGMEQTKKYKVQEQNIQANSTVFSDHKSSKPLVAQRNLGQILANLKPDSHQESSDEESKKVLAARRGVSQTLSLLKADASQVSSSSTTPKDLCDQKNKRRSRSRSRSNSSPRYGDDNKRQRSSMEKSLHSEYSYRKSHRNDNISKYSSRSRPESPHRNYHSREHRKRHDSESSDTSVEFNKMFGDILYKNSARSAFPQFSSDDSVSILDKYISTLNPLDQANQLNKIPSNIHCTPPNRRVLICHACERMLSDPKFACQFCNLKFKFSRNLLHHEYNLHSDRVKNVISCIECKKNFTSLAYYDNHFNLFHMCKRCFVIE